MLRGLLFSTVLLGTMAASEPAEAKKSKDLPVTIAVIDESGQPIASATIRAQQEAMNHNVNHETGRWTADSFYLADGSRVAFAPKQDLEFEITAPGYVSSQVQFRLRKRKNLITVTLRPLDLEADPEEIEDPIISFARSRPID